MTKFAVLDNTTGQAGRVVNIAIAADQPNFGWIDITGVVPAPQVGWQYDGSGGFTEDSFPLEPISIRQIDFKRRLTKGERKLIRTAGKNDDDVEDFIDLLNSSISISLDDPDVIAGLQALSVANPVIVQPERIPVILDYNLKPRERLSNL